MKLPTVQRFPFSCYFMFLRSKYSPQHPVLKHPQSMLCPSYYRPSFTPVQNNWQNYGFACFQIYLPRQENGRQKTLNRMVASFPRIQSVINLFVQANLIS
jgi:hypothetical protein